jgi:ArsR family transcriptional regulator, arsenate/arsenite/antimonite-responsive transcriptional repressor / arsenate reductase (thioredoxin)
LVDVVAVNSTPPAVLSLLADPHRWHLLVELARSDRRVGELTELTGTPQSLVSYHLAELRNAGLVAARRSSADRRDMYYRVDLRRCRDLLADAGGRLHPGLGLVPAAPPLDGARHGATRRVLFLCTGNSARSQMAEALLEDRSGHTIAARSAGSHPKPLHPNAVRVMAERGIDIAGNTTKHLRRFTRTRFDRVVTLCDKVREICPELPGPAPRTHWSIADPAASGTDDETYPAFEQVADELEDRIDLLVADLADRTIEGSSHAR